MKAAHRLMQEAVSRGVFPGGVLHVRVRGRDLFCESYGRADIFADQPMSRETVFDLASLTKPLATAPAVLKLVQDGRLHLDGPIGNILPEFRHTDKQDITPAQLLLHTSGLPAHRGYFCDLAVLAQKERKAALLRLLVETALAYEPGQEQIYSDLGYMVLAYLVEAVSRQRLDAFVRDALYAPLGIAGLFFIDLDNPSLSETDTRPPAFAATENCPRRGCLIKGMVHDDNAYEAGGIAGQAGLFGTTAAVARFLDMLVEMYHGKTSNRVLSRKTACLMLAPRPGAARTYGFDTPDLENSSAGRLFSPASVGHLGFTGVSMWLDVDREIMILLFTNRIHPNRGNAAIKMFRPLLHDTVMENILGRQ